ncbi:hypothetical protein V5799_015411 [Amblyomma americanum]|uniref:Lipocal-1 1 n=1 Tax=Amblyomma americanum TaxID=6943 RepID=A0AAQ4F9D5_AMBAM
MQQVSARKSTASEKMVLMTLMSAAGLASVFLPCALGGNPSFPERNPALGPYQNEGNCFPLQDSYYIMYRNYEEDPLFGGDAKCIIITETGPFVGAYAPFTVQYGGDQTANVKARLSVFTWIHCEEHYSGGMPGIIFNLTSIYTDCARCKVFRHSYIDNGKGCSLWKPKAALNEDIPCCEFVYDLVCGVSPKYQIYENC